MARHPDTDLLDEISRLLHYHDSLGIKEYPRTEMLTHFLQQRGRLLPAEPQSSKPKKTAPSLETPGKKHTLDHRLAKKTTLEDVLTELGDCQRCPLHKTRTSIVFGQGSAKAKLVIIFDAPTEDDDAREAPVQGEAGVLLDKMLSAIGLSRQDVYITSLVKCFPGRDAKPAADEISTCLPFLFRQLEIICPTVICAMGTQAAQALLHSRQSLFQLRGRFYNFNELCSTELAGRIVLMPSLPPALLLENSELKKASWQDLQLIQKKLAEK